MCVEEGGNLVAITNFDTSVIGGLDIVTSLPMRVEISIHYILLRIVVAISAYLAFMIHPYTGL